jgi:hemerythrin-like domain-containing protein
MNAIQVLRSEHDAILKMLDGLDLLSDKLSSNASVATDTLNGYLEFFRLFADRCHHGKEEEVLFPLLEQRGIPRDGGPIGVMLYEHDHGRNLLQEMGAAAAEHEKDPKSAVRRWVQAAREYSQLLREHILKENNVLFGMAERVLSPEEQSSLAQEFEKAEIEKMGAGTHERLHRRMEELLSRVSRLSAGVS